MVNWCVEPVGGFDVYSNSPIFDFPEIDSETKWLQTTWFQSTALPSANAFSLFDICWVIKCGIRDTDFTHFYWDVHGT